MATKKKNRRWQVRRLRRALNAIMGGPRLLGMNINRFHYHNGVGGRAFGREED